MTEGAQHGVRRGAIDGRVIDLAGIEFRRLASNKARGCAGDEHSNGAAGIVPLVADFDPHEVRRALDRLRCDGEAVPSCFPLLKDAGACAARRHQCDSREHNGNPVGNAADFERLPHGVQSSATGSLLSRAA